MRRMEDRLKDVHPFWNMLDDEEAEEAIEQSLSSRK